MKVMVVSNAGLWKAKAIHALAEAGLSSFIISVDAATRETHEQNRGLPGVCERIKEANAMLKRRKLHATASVTMSRLVDYQSLPDFRRSLGFDCAVFSYPLKYLPSNFRGFADSPLVDYDKEELCAAYEQVKRLKKRFHVVNPRLSLEEMQRFVRGERPGNYYPAPTNAPWRSRKTSCCFLNEPYIDVSVSELHPRLKRFIYWRV